MKWLWAFAFLSLLILGESQQADLGVCDQDPSKGVVDCSNRNLTEVPTGFSASKEL